MVVESFVKKKYSNTIKPVVLSGPAELGEKPLLVQDTDGVEH